MKSSKFSPTEIAKHNRLRTECLQMIDIRTAQLACFALWRNKYH